MSFDPVYLLTLLAPFILFYAYLRYKTYKGPPHVIGLPIVGYMPFLGREPYLKFHELVHKYGPIYSLYLGANYTVVLCSYDIVQEAFVEKGNLFNSRPSYLPVRVYEYETAFALQDGEAWKVTRNFTMSTLKNLGFGTHFTKNFAQMEIQEFIRELKDHNGKPVEVKPALSKSNNMLLFSLLTGKRYDRNDEAGWPAQVTATAIALICTYIYDITSLFPWLRKVPFVKMYFKNATMKFKDKLWSLVEVEMGSLRTTYSPSSEPDNFIHSWYSEQEKRNRNDDPHKHLFSDFSLKNNLDFLIQASTDTTSTTMHWAFLYLVLRPDVQERIHQEIDQHIGHNREPAWDDAKDMNYTKAFLMEVHRRGTVIPWGAFHSNRVKSEIRDFEIPQDTIIVCNFWSLNHDPVYFPDPYTFDPERFLDGDGKYKPPVHINPFSFGRRQCPGKQVAEMLLFLYLTSILQVFELRAVPNSSLSDRNCNTDQNLFRRPMLDAVVFNVRQKHE